MLRAVVRYGIRIAFAPARTASEIVNDPGSLRCGVIAWLLLSAAYATSALIGYLNGFGAVVTALLSTLISFAGLAPAAAVAFTYVR